MNEKSADDGSGKQTIEDGFLILYPVLQKTDLST
jgi:hypothetical protein